MATVSIIIPVLNEAKTLGRTLRNLSILDPQPLEIIVVDGGSGDETLAIAQTYPVQIISADQAGRAQQMNAGAHQAQGDILCFLHGDTLIPDDAIAVMEQTLDNPVIAGAGFISLMRGSHSTRWGISLHNYLKTYYAPFFFRPYRFWRQGLRLLFGDQVIFCRRQQFQACGGFDGSLPIMEEADLCLKLSDYGRICQVNRIVQTCDRRVAHWGSLKATGIYLYIGILWGMGVSATYLKRFYDDVR